ncbi:MAG: hypothetical protein Q9157_002960 [Trypethelium eluteriae]
MDAFRLAPAQSALQALEANPQLLDHAQRSFGASPPPYRSNQFHDSTLSEEPGSAGGKQQLAEDQRRQFLVDREASRPYQQFDAQTIDEKYRLWRQHSVMKFMPHMPIGVFAPPAYESVKNRWIEQGIWKDSWTDGHPMGGWKHEYPPRTGLDSDSDTEAKPLFGVSPRPSPFPERRRQQKAKQPDRHEQDGEALERYTKEERERNASRPFYQFLYQISKEREGIENEDATSGTPTPLRKIKVIWTERGIWNDKWGVLPGMSWKHEEPCDEYRMNDRYDALCRLAEQINYEAGEGPSRPNFGATTITHAQEDWLSSNDREAQTPPRFYFGNSDHATAWTNPRINDGRKARREPPRVAFLSPIPDESNDHGASEMISTSQQGWHGSTGSTGVSSDGMEERLLAQKSVQSSVSEPDAIGQESWLRRPPVPNTEASHSAAKRPAVVVHGSRVSKSDSKKRGAFGRRINGPGKVLAESSCLPLATGPDEPDSQHSYASQQASPEEQLSSQTVKPASRRSKRIQKLQADKVNSAIGRGVPESSKRPVQARLKRNAKASSKVAEAAKPRGISKPKEPKRSRQQKRRR